MNYYLSLCFFDSVLWECDCCAVRLDWWIRERSRWCRACCCGSAMDLGLIWLRVVVVTDWVGVCDPRVCRLIRRRCCWTGFESVLLLIVLSDLSVELVPWLHLCIAVLSLWVIGKNTTCAPVWLGSETYGLRLDLMRFEKFLCAAVIRQIRLC